MREKWIDALDHSRLPHSPKCKCSELFFHTTSAIPYNEKTMFFLTTNYYQYKPISAKNLNGISFWFPRESAVAVVFVAFFSFFVLEVEPSSAFRGNLVRTRNRNRTRLADCCCCETLDYNNFQTLLLHPETWPSLSILVWRGSWNQKANANSRMHAMRTANCRKGSSSPQTSDEKPR